MAQGAPEGKKLPKSFEALTPPLAEWILDFTSSMGFARTTPVQAMAIPLLMGNKDLVVEAVTGSGKTLSFLIPIVSRILAAEEPNKKGYVRSIVVAPTKELASQIYEVCRDLLKFHPPSAATLDPRPTFLDDDEMDGVQSEAPPVPLGPSVVPQLLTGGRTKLNEDIATFAEVSPNLLIGTPKRLLEVLQSSRVILKRHWFDLLVLDEADRLLDPNFEGDLQKILELVPKERRTGLFSASVSEAVDELVRVGMRYPFKISAKVRSKSGALDKKTPESLRLFHVVTKPTLKLPMLKAILQKTKAEKVILYVSTRAGVDYWNHVLPPILDAHIFPVHGDYKAPIRAKNLQRFRDCTTPAILLTTDVLARGIDIPDIDLVIQLDPPSQPKDFIHRCGRTGRAGRRGIAITFLSPGEEDYVKYLDLQGTKLEPYPEDLAVTADDAVTVRDALRKVLMSKRELHDRSQKAFVSWVQAYTKQLPADIFAVKSLDWYELGKAWGLLQWPKMPELKKWLPEAVKDRKIGLDLPEDLNLNGLAYADKVREAQRQADMEARARGEKTSRAKDASAGTAADLRRRKERAWSGQKAAKDQREERRERKEVRRKADRFSKMSDAEKKKALELEQLIAEVRERGVQDVDEGDFEGFDD